HYEGDAQPYKPEDEASAWRERDPLEVAARRLAERGEMGPEEIDRVRAEAAERVEATIERARELPIPDLEEAYADVYGE
ncbi:MAG TPA: thiamine pyrophosphate-dependent enzyme, partial [Solirubrobacterales bacterium]